VADTVELPGIGKVERRWLYVGGALVAGIAGYAWWSRRGAPVVDSAVSEGVVSDDTIGEPVQGNVQYAGAVNEDVEVIDTNAEWAQHAVDLLEQNGYERSTVSSALGEFLSRRALDASETNIVQAALAVAGPPPQGEYAIIPEVGSKPPATTFAAPTGLIVTRNYGGKIVIDWNAVEGAPKYRVTVVNKTAGGTGGATVTASSYTRSVTRGATYVFTVQAVDAAGNRGPSASVTAKAA